MDFKTTEEQVRVMALDNVNLEEDSTFITQHQVNLLDAIPLDSEKGVDYRKLRRLLKTGQWKEADDETLWAMLKALNKANVGCMDASNLKEFPCTDLKTIDQFWVTASNGHFGFSVQKKIWEECGSPIRPGENWNQFCIRVGWQNQQATDYVSYFDLRFNPSLSPRGELPVRCMRGRWLVPVGSRGRGIGAVSFLSKRLEDCSKEQF
jgi:hypothetical protein